MSREQRRLNRRSGSGGSGGASRRTPVKVAGGSRFPTLPIALAAGVLLIVGLIAYLIIQAGSGGGLSGPQKAAADSSPDIPGTYIPDQGRGHFSGGYPTNRALTPFCPGVPQSAEAAAASGAAPVGTGTAGAAPSAVATPSPTATATATAATTETAGSPASDTTPGATATVQANCYASNPPSSGKHLNVLRNIDVGNGAHINIPPDPDVYPDDVEIPREGIPHILEHAGVFVGWHCKDGDTACEDVVQQVKDIVNDRIDNHDDRVVMAKDTDLPENSIGLSSWTRVLDMDVGAFDKNLVTKFIGTNACRVDWERFCK